jgi:hypothetical protein
MWPADKVCPGCGYPDFKSTVPEPAVKGQLIHGYNGIAGEITAAIEKALSQIPGQDLGSQGHQSLSEARHYFMRRGEVGQVIDLDAE